MRACRLLPVLLFAASTYAHAALKPGCQYFTQQDADTLIGEPAKPGMDFGQSLCNFADSPKSSISLQGGIRPGTEGMNPVTILDQQTRSASVAHTPVTPISGVGDKAILVVDNGGGKLTLEVAAKGSLVMVAVRSAKPIDTPALRDRMVKAAKVIISRL